MTRPSWSFLDEFNLAHMLRPRLSWSVVDALELTARRMLEDERARFCAAMNKSGQQSMMLGGDPLSVDWARFRPLRLGREEDWSDWLAHLLESSTTGAFARYLLQPATTERGSVTSWIGRAQREQPTSGHRRTDIRFEPLGCSFHIEVKIGDKGFEKTFETAEQLEVDVQKTWVHLILLPEADLDAWFECARSARRRVGVGVLTWRNVARALRQAFALQDESLPWRVWAWSFCGAVEQILLRHPLVPHIDPGTAIRSVMDLGGAISVIRLFEEVSNDAE